ncbi:hypothetical protein [Micromonospora pisi]|uniref:hypothetical protein n=1 Tax=Micromonospora pisi TaxID=589240 RepID=UPI0014771418|nr:hypothetical protein [Micromonospora pisi]
MAVRRAFISAVFALALVGIALVDTLGGAGSVTADGFGWGVGTAGELPGFGWGGAVR